MSRIARAARQLEKEVRALRADAEVETYGEVDGLGVHRTLRFDEKTGEWLAPLLDELADVRLVDHHVTEAGALHVTVAADRRGDFTDPYNLASADTVVNAKAEEPQEPEPAAKKAAAKKAAKKSP